ncbi:hypothetical protein ACSBR1_030294 [Camellia fascicularis]
MLNNSVLVQLSLSLCGCKMEPAKIDWKSTNSVFVEDGLYEHINAPKWLDFSAPDQSVDDEAWFCRPDCNHPKTVEDFLKSTPPSKISPSRVAFAKITFKKPPILLLDEPSNHLIIQLIVQLDVQDCKYFNIWPFVPLLLQFPVAIATTVFNFWNAWRINSSDYRQQYHSFIWWKL